MKISVKVKASAKETRVEDLGAGNFLVAVKEKPLEGKANYAVRCALAEYFGLPKSKVLLVGGEKSKNKFFSITS